MATPEPVEPAATQVPTEASAPTPEPTDEHASREAAGYRRRLRDTEAERDALRSRIDEYERRDVEAVARELGAAVPADLWTLVQLDELRVDGVVDIEAARTRISDLLRDRPTWRRSVPDLGAGVRGNGPEAQKPGLAALLGKR
jgi:hypothetical protein